MPAMGKPAAASPAAIPTIDPIKLFKKYFWVLFASGIVAAAFGVGLFLVLARFFPRYDVEVYFQVLPAIRDFKEIAAGDDTEKEQFERFMSTQAQTMISDKVLERALNFPGYTTEAANWIKPFSDSSGAIAKADAIRELKEDVYARPLPKSQYILLTMGYRHARDATFIAQQITNAYMNEIGTSTDARQSEFRETLVRSVADLTNEISQKERARDRIITENQLESIESVTSSTYKSMEEKLEQLGAVQDSITSLVTQQQEYERLLSTPGGIVFPETIRRTAEEDPLVRQTQSTLQQLQAADRALEKQDLGVNHPSRISVRSQIDGTLEELESSRTEIMSSMFSGLLDQIRQGLMQLRARESELLRTIDEDKARLNELASLLQEIKELERQIERLGERLEERQAELQNLNMISGMESSNRVIVFQPARTPDKAAFPNYKFVIPAGFVGFLSFVAALIVLREMLDQRIKGPADVAMIPRTPVLGMLPMASEDPSRPERAETAFHDRPTGVMAESVRQVRVAIVKRMQQAGHRSLLVVPATPESGATTLVTNLSEACARADLKTLVIDANLRRPRIHSLFNLEASPGLVDVLANKATIEDAVCSTDNPNLDVLTVGSAEHRMFERIVTDPMGELLTKLEARYDIVIIDVAPAIVAGDAVALAHRCGSTLLVARAMTEKRGTIARLKNELSDTRAEFLGVVINAVQSSAGGYFRKNIRASHEYQQKGRKAAKA